MSRKSWGATWPACYARRGKRRAVPSPGSHRETLFCRGGRGGPAPAHRGSGRIAPGGCLLPGAVLPHGAGRPAGRFAEAFPAQCGQFPERWRPFSGALRTRSGRQPHLLRTFRSDTTRDNASFCLQILTLSENIHSVRKLSFSDGSTPGTDSGGKALSRLMEGCLIRRPARKKVLFATTPPSCRRAAPPLPSPAPLSFFLGRGTSEGRVRPDCLRLAWLATYEGSAEQWGRDAVRFRRSRAQTIVGRKKL